MRNRDFGSYVNLTTRCTVGPLSSSYGFSGGVFTARKCLKQLGQKPLVKGTGRKNDTSGLDFPCIPSELKREANFSASQQDTDHLIVRQSLGYTMRSVFQQSVVEYICSGAPERKRFPLSKGRFFSFFFFFTFNCVNRCTGKRLKVIKACNQYLKSMLVVIAFLRC